MKRNKSIAAFASSLILTLSILAGCASPEPKPSETTFLPDTAVPKVLLAVSFGTSYNDSREATIGAIEKKLQEAYPDYEVRRAFTSQIIIDKLAKRDNLQIDNVTQAMERLVADGVKEVLIQPTHVMSGFEYDDIIAEIAPYQNKFEDFRVGSPLLTADADYDKVVSILATETQVYHTEGTAIVFMGHGTAHEANFAYAKLQEYITAAGHSSIFIGTAEAEPTLDEVMARVKDSGAKKVVLLPFMIVAGDHASNDMAGDGDDSWKTMFEAQGYEVECVLKGLGEYPGIQELYVEHAANAQ